MALAGLAPVLIFLAYPACFLYGGVLVGLGMEVWQSRKREKAIAYGWLAWSVSRRGPEPPQGRFNAGQKLNTAIIAGLMVVFTFSGTLMYLQEVNAQFRGTSAILVHDAAMYVAIPLVLGRIRHAVSPPMGRVIVAVLNEVPAIAVEVLEHGDHAVGLLARRANEPDAAVHHLVVIGPEIRAR